MDPTRKLKEIRSQNAHQSSDTIIYINYDITSALTLYIVSRFEEKLPEISKQHS
jgi:hypothetical protein